jgi:ABC-type nitrate/sulfonate/bicarbonate transport system substrate-binding protein
MNVSAVTTAFYRAEPKVLACYVYALNEAVAYIATHRDEAAAITVASIPGDSGTVREMRTRLDREIPLYLGDGSEPPLYIGEAKLRRQLALLYRYHRVELPSPSP